MRDYARAAGFRRLAAELGTTPAMLAHRYALSMPVDTVVLGVITAASSPECVAAAEAGPLPADLLARNRPIGRPRAQGLRRTSMSQALEGIRVIDFTHDQAGLRAPKCWHGSAPM